MYTMTSKDAAATMGAGRRLAALVRPGDVITLSGQLGAGKTTFAAGFGEGLGIDEPVTSPSFVLVRTYRSGFTPLVHVDAYRLGSLGEFEDLDVLDEASEGVLLIEWGEAVVGVLPEDHLRKLGFSRSMAGCEKTRSKYEIQLQLQCLLLQYVL